MQSKTKAGTGSVSRTIAKTGQDRSSFPVRNAQDVIHVNMEGKRFSNETPTTWEKQVYQSRVCAVENKPAQGYRCSHHDCASLSRISLT
jgi:hypothetical protein